MHGLGNDFMVIDGIHQPFDTQLAPLKQWADRHYGVGFDQLLLIEAPESDDVEFKYRIFNADGSEVEQCGNGARCFARYVTERHLTNSRVIPVETQSGKMTLEMMTDSKVRVNMGIPVFEPKQIPLDFPERNDFYSLNYGHKRVQFYALSMGNPHAVIVVDDIETAPVQALGRFIESHELFPQRVNVGFMQILDDNHIKLRVFERGAGETNACGSGACAAMVAGVQAGLLKSSVSVQLKGGELQIDWQGEGEPVLMTGETARVFDGEIEL